VFIVSLRVFHVRNVRPFEQTTLPFRITSFARSSSSHSDINRCGTSSWRNGFRTSISLGKLKSSICKYWQYAQITPNASSTAKRAILFRMGLYSRNRSMRLLTTLDRGRGMQSVTRRTTYRVVPDRDAPWGCRRMPPRATVRAQHSHFAVSQGGEFGQLHCKLGHAVQIEPGLRPRSPENGNISDMCRRLSVISLPQRPVSEPGDC